MAMSVLYRVLLTATLFLSTVDSQSGTIINVYQSGDKSKADKIESVRAVVFSVGRKAGFAPSSSTRIQMDRMFFNKDGYFDMQKSIFTAPMSGVYAFYFGASSSSGKRVYLNLKVGNPEKIIASTYDYNTVHGQASGFVIVEMKVGDHASVWMPGSYATDSHSVPSTYFSGFLVTAIETAAATSKQC